jgi:hypothetical protein
MIERIAERGAVSLAERTSRRSFLGRVGMGFVALVGGPFVAIALRPDRAEAHHLCGHTFTTGSCPHPYAPRSRVDRYDKPLHPYYGYPIDDRGDIYTSHSQSRRKICQEVTPAKYPYTGSPVFGVAWARCCNHRIRKIHDCCSYSDTRINGDASVTGYCNGGRKVFCILYRDTNVRC